MTFSIFGLTGYAYGLVAGVSILCCLGLAIWLSGKNRIPADAVLLFGLIGMPLGLIFSRLFFCAAKAAYFFETIGQPIRILQFWDGGYSMMGMLFGVFAAAALTARIKKFNLREFMDSLAAPMALLIFGLRIAESFTGELGVGRQVDVDAIAQALPFLFISETLGKTSLYHLAVYRYEAAFALIIFAVMLRLYRAHKSHRAGDLSLLFFALYGAAQILFESMRNDGHMTLDSNSFIRVQQVIALLLPVIVLMIFLGRYAKAHGTRRAVTAAWSSLPVMALILVMMVAPINHVLDLSDQMLAGILLLSAFSIYLMLFLRIRGANLRSILSTTVMVISVIGCLLLEFSMDGSSSLLRDYTLMGLCCLALFLSPYLLWRKLLLEED